MSGWWLVSYLVLWLMAASTLVVLLVVLRQLGLLYLRVQGGGLQLDEGPSIGSIIGPFDEIEDDNGEQFRFPDSDVSLNLILFASPHCRICKDALQGLRAATRRRDVNVLVISEGEPHENDRLRMLVNGAGRFLTSLRHQRELGITTIPYGIVVNETGVVLQKRIVNNLDDLEELLDRAESEAHGAVEAIPAEGRVRI